MANIQLPELHFNQLHCKKNSKRFTVLCCGRRFGKTTLAIDLICTAAKKPRLLAYCAPTYKMLNKTWRKLKSVLRSVIAEKSEALKQIVLRNGTIIDFWSLDNEDAIRGNAYHFIVIDEVAIIKDFLKIWTNSIRPLLTDYSGGAWFLSTPKGFYNDFYTIFSYGSKFEEWQSFQMPTLSNPNIKENEILTAKEQLPEGTFRQEYLAEFVNFEGNLFAESFNFEKHVSTVKYNPEKDVYISFDFNIVNSAIVFQNYDNTIFVVKEYHKESWDLERLCTEIVTDFNKNIYYITGDASGKAGSALTSGNVSAYELIKGYFGIVWKQIYVPNSNPSHLNSRLQTNVMLKSYDIKIDKHCEFLIKDLQMVVTDKNGKIDKRDDSLTHLLDCFRYYLWNFHYMTFKGILTDKRLIENKQTEW